MYSCSVHSLRPLSDLNEISEYDSFDTQSSNENISTRKDIDR